MKACAAVLALACGLPVISLPRTASAQAARTWISTNGDDANSCSRTAPCRTVNGALERTTVGGQINCLDVGFHDTLTIDRSITIDCRAQPMGMTTPGSSFEVVRINDGLAGNSVVTLIGFEINGSKTGAGGIALISGGRLTIRDSRISNLATVGVNLVTETDAQVDIIDSVIVDNAGGGVAARPVGAAKLLVTMKNVTLAHNLFGLRAETGARVSAVDSSFSGNVNNGILALAGADVTVAQSVVASNGVNGVVASGAAAVVRVRDSAVTFNGVGLNSSAGGAIVTTSPSSNLVAGNGADGTFNGGDSLN